MSLKRMMQFVAFFITIAVLNMFLGSKQQKPNDRYAITSAVLFTFLAVISIVLLRGTVFFPASALGIALLLVVHRAIAHFSMDPQIGEECPLFQCKQARCHETWAIAALVAGLVSLMHL